MARYRRVPPKAQVPQPPPARTVTVKSDYVASLRKDALVDLATSHGVDASGTKADIVARLEDES